MTEPPSERSRVRRIAEKADYERATIDAILDAGLIAHVGVTGDDGQPFVLPCAYARVGDDLLLHGSVASRLMRTAGAGAPICVTVTLLDGLVAARSLFHSSMHYRSVMILGEARVIEDPAEVLAALLALSDALIPGRVPEARAPSASELRQTRVVALRIDEASAKVSDSWPGDPPEDVVLDVWAGVVPLEERWGVPRPAPDLPSGLIVSPSITLLADDHRLVRPEGPTG